MTGAGAKQREEDLRLALSSVAATTLGRRFLYSLLEDAGVFRSSFNESSLRMAFDEGQRNRGLLLLLELQRVHPAACESMLAEGLAWAQALEKTPEAEGD